MDELSKEECRMLFEGNFRMINPQLLYRKELHLYHTLVAENDDFVKGQSFNEYIEKSLAKIKRVEKKTNSKIKVYSRIKPYLKASQIGSFATLVLEQSYLPIFNSGMNSFLLEIYQKTVQPKTVCDAYFSKFLEEKKTKKSENSPYLYLFAPMLYSAYEMIRFCIKPNYASFASSVTMLSGFGRIFCNKRLMELSWDLKLCEIHEKILTIVSESSSTMNTEAEKNLTKKKI